MKIKNEQKRNKGITLIALVITIIVMLILVAVTISMAVNGGLFNYAGNAVGETNNAIKTEQELGSGKITIDNKVYNSIDEYLNGETEESTLKPMVLKLNVTEESSSVELCIYREKYSEYDYNGNEIVTELPNNTDVTIDWGDGVVEHYTSNNLFIRDGYGYVAHDYTETNDEFIVTLTGKCNVIEFTLSSMSTEIQAWGNTETYYYNFSSSGLVGMVSPEKNTFKNVIDFSGSFSGTGVTTIPNEFFANCTSVKSFMTCFFACENLTSIPEDLFKGCVNVESFDHTFAYCGLLEIPENLFNDCQNVKSFRGTFVGCGYLNGPAIPLWEREQDPDGDGITLPNGYGCYAYCEGLENYEAIPYDWRNPRVTE